MLPLSSAGSESGSLRAVGGSNNVVPKSQATLAELAKTVDAMRDRLAEMAMGVGLKVDPQTKIIMVEVTEMSSGAPIMEFPITEVPKRMPSSMGDPRLLDAKA